MTTWRDSRSVLVILGMTALFAVPAPAQLAVPSDGSDGAFSPTSNLEIDLNEAAEAAWDVSPNPTPGKGVYDGQKWAVVFRYSAVNIPAGVAVTFKNRAGYPPVVWLVQGDVTIDGTLTASAGREGYVDAIHQPGPGGFRGGHVQSGLHSEAGPGFGPGGAMQADAGSTSGAGGSFGTRASGFLPSQVAEQYGSPQLLPLMGGSGGTARNAYSRLAGAGGGAILIATGGRFTLNGRIEARGGWVGWDPELQTEVGPGSGGAVRIICDTLAGGGGLIDATAGNPGGPETRGGDGRVRLEYNVSTMTSMVWGTVSGGFPSNPPQVWPPDDTPVVKIIEINGQATPADPKAQMSLREQDVSIATGDPVTWRVESRNVPSDWTVILRVNPMSGREAMTSCTMEAGGTGDLAYWNCTLAMPAGYSVAQVRAKAPDYVP